MTPIVAEFLGTTLLLLLGNGVVANVLLNATKGNQSGWVVITISWGLAVFVGVAVAGPYSGAHLNPAVTLGLAGCGKFPWNEVTGFMLAQFAGAATGAFLVWLMYQKHFEVTQDGDTKLAVFCTGPAIRSFASNFFSEVTGTFVLVFVVLYLSPPEISAKGLENAKIGLGTLGALPVSLLVISIGMSLGGTTGYAINPARDFSPRLVHALLPIKEKRNSDWSYAWIPVLGPFAGAVLAACLFMLLQTIQ